MNETTVIAGIVAAIVTVLTKVIDALVARRRDRQSGSIEHRKLLSDDERAFRQAVLDEVKELREELDKRSEQLETMRTRVVESRQAQLDAERAGHESERRSQMLETQITELRNLHEKISQARRDSRQIEDDNG